MQTGNFVTVVDILRDRAQIQTDQPAYIFLKNGELQPTTLTYGQLEQRARAIASHLSSFVSERAVLIYPYESGLEFIAAFYGCLYAGVMAVPCHPPRNRRDFADLQARIVAAQAKIVLTETSLLHPLKTNLANPNLANPNLANSNLANPNPDLHWFTSESLTESLPFQPPLLQSKTLAFLQFTSGSTGLPKGVMITHACIRSNQHMLELAFGSDAHTINVGWLPLFHDMGLMGNVLQPLHLGIPSILMSPIAFVQKPLRWLQAMSHYQATTSGAPNFAYDLLCRQVTDAQRQNLDLSHWELAFSGAEAVQSKTLEQFADLFAECGFRREAFYPCYGMAEATLFITGGLKTELPRAMALEGAALKENRVVLAPSADPRTINSRTINSRTITGCGRPWLDTQIVIVNPDTLMLTDGVGEIWVAGSGVGKGYWNLPEESDRTFHARLADFPGKAFLRTGDLGFLQDGELYITGRLKELLVFWGFNHYPQHIEQTVAACHPALRVNGSAAFAVAVEGEERLVIAQEVERSYRHCLDVETVVEAMRWAVFDQHFVDLYGIVFLKPGGIPKTSSGKIQRRVCQELFLTGQFESLAEWRSPQPSDMSFLLKKYLSPMTHVCRYWGMFRGRMKKWLYWLMSA